MSTADLKRFAICSKNLPKDKCGFSEKTGAVSGSRSWQALRVDDRPRMVGALRSSVTADERGALLLSAVRLAESDDRRSPRPTEGVSCFC